MLKLLFFIILLVNKFILWVEIFIFFQLHNFLPLFASLFFKLWKFLVTNLIEHCLFFSLKLFMHLKIFYEALVSLENTWEKTFFLLTPRKNFCTWIPTQRILRLWIDSALKRNGSSWFRSCLQTKFIRSVAKHYTFETSNWGFRHVSLSSINTTSTSTGVYSVSHFFKI